MAITYRTLYNQALNVIKSVCINVSNYGALPSSFKSGYTETRQSGIKTVYLRINNPIYQVSTSTVDNEFYSLMSSYGITSRLDQTTTARGLLNFYTALVTFIQSKVCICQARNSGRYICYESGHGYTKLSSLSEGDVIYASDANQMCTDFIRLIESNAKGRPITYNISA